MELWASGNGVSGALLGRQDSAVLANDELHDNHKTSGCEQPTTLSKRVHPSGMSLLGVVGGRGAAHAP